MMQSQSRIKLNRRGLTELVLACAFLSLLTFAVWSWQSNGGHVTAMDATLPEAQRALIPQVLQHPTIMLSIVVSEFILLLAIVLALVPPAWWLRADHLWGTDSAGAATPLRWLGQRIQQIGHPKTEGGESYFVVNEAGEPIYYEQPGTPPGIHPVAESQAGALPGQPAGVPMAGQPAAPQMQPGQPVPGQPIAGQMQPGQPIPGQPVPGQPVPGQLANGTETPPAQAGTPQPAAPLLAQQTDILNFDEEEDDPLADLADIKDILSSAFDEDAGVDPDREALSRSLDDISVMTIRTTARQIAATFNQ